MLAVTVCCWKCGVEAVLGHDGAEEVSRRPCVMICCADSRSWYIMSTIRIAVSEPLAMKMRLGCRVAALTTMDEDALAGPEIVEQPRAVLHVIARAKQIADEKEYSGGSLGHFDPRPNGYAVFTFYSRSGTCQSSTPPIMRCTRTSFAAFYLESQSKTPFIFLCSNAEG